MEGKHKKVTSFKQLSSSQRTTIFAMLENGESIKKISFRLHKHPSTIYRELKRYCHEKEGQPTMSGKRCKYLGKKYYICTQCPMHKIRCNRDKRYYDPNNAQERTYKTRHEKNRGPMLSSKEFSVIDNILYERVMKGHSIEQIWHTCEEVGRVSIITIRRWINRGYTKIKPINLRRQRRFKKSYAYERNPVDLALNACIKLNRTMDDHQLYIKKYPDHIPIQTDSVEGRKGDELRLLTVMFVEIGFQLAFLYHVSNASQEVSTKLLSVIRAARKYTSKPLVVLTDNGIEFSKITLIEKVKNVHVFFADPYKSTDKANCERNHELIRYVIPKGYSLDGFTQKQMNEIMSNINSYARESLQWKKPVSLFRQAFGSELLQKWHIEDLPDSEVYLRSQF